jgi:hypothetical protein
MKTATRSFHRFCDGYLYVFYEFFVALSSGLGAGWYWGLYFEQATSTGGGQGFWLDFECGFCAVFDRKENPETLK